MTMHTTQSLYDELNQTLVMVEAQIRSLVKETEGYTMPVYDVRNRDGKPILSEMLAAKANLISSMARLKAAEMESRIPRKR